MTSLTSAQRKHLRGLAHSLNPSAVVGHKGVTQALVDEIEAALKASELIKVRFIDHKEKEVKGAMVEEICSRTRCHLAGTIGHVAILFRQQKDPSKRKIVLP